MQQIEDHLLEGRLNAGDRLPSEREFALLLGVSRPSLRESLRVLEALGIVEVKTGAGPDGGTSLVERPGPGFVNLLKMQLALGQFEPREVIDTRVALEVWAASEAARRHDTSDLDVLSGILDRMDGPDLDATEFNRLDALFHVTIAESAGNALTAHLMTSMRVAINRQMVQAYAKLPDWRETAKTVRHEHRHILAAIREGDASQASQLVQSHIESFYEMVGKLGWDISN
ncbi:DNA-binding FadR family transcriptional regulator [Microbacterium foliorum]|uniref:FadR/GntR family transcriptional regulator n=1 Tax=Microbacterium foliorum TaxID=104336 RepID=UPI0020A042B8|nr:FadR/GntR family transcriptional regulator [Microbacterium foliorum]MCP1428197.1 DNA-binding FadR family transcriptional regulator [Microbacterium foliorum]